ncbi:MAG: S-layer homology domain-containing protein [Faecousia sp.]
MRKKWISSILALVLCLSLAVPAMAAYLATSEEAKAKYSFTTSMDDYDNRVNEAMSCYELDRDGKLGDPIDYAGYYVVGSDTDFTVTNTSTEKDFYLWVKLTWYVKGGWASRGLKDAEGKYLLDNECSLRNGGYFEGTAGWDGTQEGELRCLTAGESVTFTGADIAARTEKAKDGFFQLTIYQYYPENDKYWYFTYVFKLDDQQAAEIAAKGKTEADDPGNPFTDVPKDAYYHDAVLWALEKNITTGMTATTFGPTATCTRGQVATFLWRAKGCPEPETKENPFTDVKESDYFCKAVLWAFENGITTGTTDTTFSPNGTCTSAHVVTFLWRANEKPAAEHTGTEYYAEAVAWAEANGLLAGTATPFAPNNLSPRADIVTYLYRDMA